MVGRLTGVPSPGSIWRKSVTVSSFSRGVPLRKSPSFGALETRGMVRVGVAPDCAQAATGQKASRKSTRKRVGKNFNHSSRGPIGSSSYRREDHAITSCHHLVAY